MLHCRCRAASAREPALGRDDHDYTVPLQKFDGFCDCRIAAGSARGMRRNHAPNEKRLRGDVLKDDSNGEYHLIMNVRAQVIDKDNAITYFYTDKVMDWSKSTEQNLVWNPKLYYLSPFLPGTIQVKVNGRVVIDRQDNANLCYNAYAWIPHHGIYLLNKRSEWTYMFYYPHYFPQYLS
ncbi:hypothetical protein Y032_0041g482 [Ancylostoma ceylanicum]|nr:hypothetical protein Y032_0041g482 [Ancylostoma ceylanicum]